MKSLLLALAMAPLLPLGSRAEPDNVIVCQIESTREHPRNSEGSFVMLRSGRLEFYFGQFYNGFEDESPARIAEVHSDDRGRTWSQPKVVVSNGENDNVMSVSVLRLASGKIALSYAVKKSAWLDCRPYVSLSSDEGKTWSEPRPVVVSPGYCGANNDRLIQTRAGRLILPIAFNRIIGTANEYKSVDWRAITVWYLSDDDGATWREAPTWWTLPAPNKVGLDEPGLVELQDGSLFSWGRTDHGEQWACRSTDGGETWSLPRPTELKSPNSPASIKRLPHSRALLAIFNDHSGRFPLPVSPDMFHGRTPLVAAVSLDDGRTWPARKVLEDDPKGNFAYTAITFVDDSVLIAYSATPVSGAHLGQLRIRRLARSWLPAGG